MRYLYLLLAVLFSFQISNAQKGFEEGNSWYQKGNYQQAIASYESVLTQKKHSAALYFNLGNCYYKLNKVAPAIYNYEKALLLAPHDAEILNNLKFAQKLQIDEVKEVPQVGFSKWIHNFTNIFNYNTWGWISISFSIIFLCFFIGYYFSGFAFYKRIFFVGMIVALGILLLCVFAASVQKRNETKDQSAIVFAEVVSVKSEPKNEASDAFLLHEGTKVQVVESLDSWSKIQLGDGTDGWIQESAIQRIK